MKAVQFVLTKTRYVLGMAGRLRSSAYMSPLSCIQFRDVPEPKLPGPDWVKIKIRYGGICGSDMALARLDSAYVPLSPFGTPTFTMGHEQVGTVTEVGAAVPGMAVGQRVVADPVLPCPARGIDPPCPQCRDGQFSRCERFTKGKISAGVHTGSCADTGGSWSPYIVAHRHQLFAVPDSVSDENAILVDALASAIPPVLRNFPADEDTVLVIGAGVVGLCVVAALRRLGSKARIVVQSRYAYQGALATQFGADRVIDARDRDYFEKACLLLGGETYSPFVGKRLVMTGGADVVYDCVGSNSSVSDAMWLARGGGRVAMVGLLGQTLGVNWSTLWFKELTVTGTQSSGSEETVAGARIRPYQMALDWMSEGGLDMSCLFTHTFALSDYREALTKNMHKSQHKMVKSAFAFD